MYCGATWRLCVFILTPPCRRSQSRPCLWEAVWTANVPRYPRGDQEFPSVFPQNHLWSDRSESLRAAVKPCIQWEHWAEDLRDPGRLREQVNATCDLSRFNRDGWAVTEERVAYLHILLFFSWNKLTDRFFKTSPWPEAEAIASLVGSGESEGSFSPLYRFHLGLKTQNVINVCIVRRRSVTVVTNILCSLL